MINSSATRETAIAHYGEVARLGQVLASPVRLRFLDLLRNGSRNVEDLAEATGVSVANSSRHLQHLRAARMVVAAREGRHVRYRLADEGVSRAFTVLRGLAETLLPEMDRLRQALGVLEDAEREALLERIRAGKATLLDVRSAEEYGEGHLPGARSIPLEELPDRLGEVPRHDEIVAYCRGPYCPLAREAAELLVAQGFRARYLDLGIADLRDLGIPLDVPRPAVARRASRIRRPRRRPSNRRNR